MTKDEKIDRILNSREWFDKNFRSKYKNNKQPFTVRCKECGSLVELGDIAHMDTRNRYRECPVCNSRFKEFERLKPTCEICGKLLTYEQYKEQGRFCSRECANSARSDRSPYLVINNILTDEYLKYLQDEVCFASLVELKRFLDIDGLLSKNIRSKLNEKLKSFNFEFKKQNYIKKDLLEEIFKLDLSLDEKAKRLDVSYDILKKNAKNFKLWPEQFTRKRIKKLNTDDKNKENFINNILIKNSKSSTSHVRDCLLKYGIKDYICEGCGRTLWNGKPIPLDLHHIDGDNRNHELLNLKFLCPNCHRQTDNYGSLNKKKRRSI